MIDIRELNNREDFNSFIETNKSDLHVVKFGASWCGPCKLLETRLKNIDTEKIGSTLFGEVEICDEDTEQLAKDFNVSSIPVLAYIKDDDVKFMSTGAVSLDDVYKKINELS